MGWTIFLSKPKLYTHDISSALAELFLVFVLLLVCAIPWVLLGVLDTVRYETVRYLASTVSLQLIINLDCYFIRIAVFGHKLCEDYQLNELNSDY